MGRTAAFGRTRRSTPPCSRHGVDYTINAKRAGPAYAERSDARTQLCALLPHHSRAQQRRREQVLRDHGLDLRGRVPAHTARAVSAALGMHTRCNPAVRHATSHKQRNVRTPCGAGRT